MEVGVIVTVRLREIKNVLEARVAVDPDGDLKKRRRIRDQGVALANVELEIEVQRVRCRRVKLIIKLGALPDIASRIPTELVLGLADREAQGALRRAGGRGCEINRCSWGVEPGDYEAIESVLE